MKYASFWKRLLGGLIDLVLLYLPLMYIHQLTYSLGFILSPLTVIFVDGIYYIFFWVRWRATPGMLLVRIKMMPLQGELTVERGIIRYLGTYISAICFMLGYIWMIWDKKNQTWQDKLAKTIVIRVETEEEEKRTVPLNEQ